MVDTTDIHAALDEYESDFPSMMMDERRFGPAKSFLLKGTAAGFDMTTEEGLATFTEYYNREQGAVATGLRRRLDAAKKRKAKMAKLSRKKNRRKK